MAVDYYQVLGIDKTDDQDLIKKAYRAKAKAFHPDTSAHPNAQTIFQEISEAFQVLSDPAEKANYDKEQQLVQLDHDQNIEELNKREPYRHRRESVFHFESENIYPPTDYVSYKKRSLIVNVIIAAVALIFLYDISYTGKVNAYEVSSVYYTYTGTGLEQDINKYQVNLSNAQIYVYSYTPPVAAGEEAYLSFSPIFGKIKAFRTSTGTSYDISGRAYVLWISILVLLVSLIGTLPVLSAERQFNAAVISGFFSILLFISLLIS